jgi:hypothetical protein
MSQHHRLTRFNHLANNRHAFRRKDRALNLFDRLADRIKVFTVTDLLRLFVAEQDQAINVDNQDANARLAFKQIPEFVRHGSVCGVSSAKKSNGNQPGEIY